MAQHKIGGTQVDEFTWMFITTLFFCTDEESFPEYCYQGEFEISEEDAMRLDFDSLSRIIELCDAFQNTAPDYLIEAYEARTGCCAGSHFAFTVLRTGAGYELGSKYGEMLDTAARTYPRLQGLIRNEDKPMGEIILM